MADEPIVVNPEVSQTPAAPTPATPTEQVTPGSEPVTTPTTDVTENLKRALQAEREEKRKLKAELDAARAQQVPVPPTPTAPPTSDIENTFYQTVANTNLLMLINKDPFVKQNLDLVEQELASTGGDVLAAVNAVKARILDKAMGESAGGVAPQVPPTQLTTAPLPEQQQAPLTGNAYRDALDGKLPNLNEEEQALIEALKQA